MGVGWKGFCCRAAAGCTLMFTAEIALFYRSSSPKLPA
jgi:hypothetical protein